MRSAASLALLLAGLATAREVPANLKAYYDANKTGQCKNPVSIEYHSGEGDANTVYCSDADAKVIYLKDNANGYADMDIDCDGADAGSGDCFNDPSTQSMTAFQDSVREFGIDDLNAHIHTYVVLGNDNSASEGDGGAKFDPQDKGIKPLSVVAVVCGDKLVYGIWGDVNGGKLTGESSISLAQMCFPNDGINGNNGHGEHDVLYIAFEGDDAVPGASANWKAGTSAEFEASLAAVGDKLVARLGNGGAGRVIVSTAPSVPAPSILASSLPAVFMPVASASASASSYPVASIPMASAPVASVPVPSIPVMSVPIASVPGVSTAAASIPTAALPTTPYASATYVAAPTMASHPIYGFPPPRIPTRLLHTVVSRPTAYPSGTGYGTGYNGAYTDSAPYPIPTHTRSRKHHWHWHHHHHHHSQATGGALPSPPPAQEPYQEPYARRSRVVRRIL